MPYYKILRETLLFIKPKFIISSHSFTPYYEDTPLRDYEIGLLFRNKGKLVNSLLEIFTNIGLKCLLNEPYNMSQGVCQAQDSIINWNYPDQPEVVLIEFRNDFCQDPKWRKKIVDALLPMINTLN